MLPFRKKRSSFPVSVSMGMHVSVSRVRPVYGVMLSLTALAGIMGTVLSFVTSCKGLISFSAGAAVIPSLAGWALFSMIYALWDKKPVASRSMLLAAGVLILLYGVINIKSLAAGYMLAVNDFAGGLYRKFAEAPPFAPGDEFTAVKQECIDNALGFTAVIISLLACRIVKRPNIILFLLATVPPAELSLYFGLVPSYPAFALLLASFCGAAAAEFTRFGVFSDPSAEKLFTKTAAQSSAAAEAAMLLCFISAVLYMGASGYSRPDKADEFRDGFSLYMKNFSWEKFAEDLHEAIIPVKTKEIIHDGRLGNTASVEFTGENVLEVTLPTNSWELYLKGLTAVNYTGSRWTSGTPVPQLETKLTSPEFFSGRALRYTEGLENLTVNDVIVRSSDRTDTMKYYPQYSAGLLETDGVRRRYGTYFPQSLAAFDNGRNIIDGTASVNLPDTMAADEQKMRTYAYTNCLDVPDTFTAAEDFFADFEGGSKWETLEYIRKKLGDECEYTLESGKKPFGSDFAQWFLTENKKGSCTHFASAAVLLCRYMGIPSRYCEGFVIKNSDIARFPAEGRYTTVSVPDSRAHAWAEVYADGFGWLVFEATPGYGNMVFSPDSEDYGDTDGVSEITSVTTEPPVFTENPDNTTVTALAGEEVSQTGSSGNSSETVYETETTVASHDSEEISGGFTESGTGIGGQDGNADGSGTGTRSTGDNGEGNGGNTDIPGTEQTGEGSIESEYDENGIGIESETASTAVFGSDEHSTPKPMSKSVKVIITVIICAALAAAAYFLLRYAETRRRRSLLKNHPDKAAAEIYRLLERLCTMAGVGGKNEELGRELTESCKIERGGELVACALKARFGEGVSCGEAMTAAEDYRAAAAVLTGLMTESRTVIAKFFLMDRYI